MASVVGMGAMRSSDPGPVITGMQGLTVALRPASR